MPHFHFHLRRGREVERDEIGVGFPDVESAYLDAYQAARDLWFELIGEGCDPMECSFEITDPTGRIVLELPFAEVQHSGHGGKGRSVSAGARIGRARRLADEIAAEVAKAHEGLRVSRALLDRARGAPVA